MLRFCLIGAGRIGKVHALAIADDPKATLTWVVDTQEGAARELAGRYGAKSATTPAAALASDDVDAVVIASATNTHVDFIGAAARAQKAIFCEKPIDLDRGRAEGALREVTAAGVPLLVAFNRRFDPSFRKLWEELRAGAVGAVELVSITSRDPGPPPVDYIKVSGGLFRDMMIHDLDMARWLLAEEPVEVFASASCLVDKAIGAAGDVDTAVVSLKTASGKLAQISNSRRAAYGYDQRVEVLGAKGMLKADNLTSTTVNAWTETGVRHDKPLFFFLERYLPAYRAEMAHFIAAVEAGTPPSPGGEDGLAALVLADAATESVKTGKPVRLTR